MDYRYVYVIGTSENPVKVGVADDPTKRLMELQIGCPDKLRIWHVVAVHFHVAGEVESASHQALADYHRHGEWFNVHADAARDAIISTARRLGRHSIVGVPPERTIIKRAIAAHDIPVGVMRAIKAYKDLRSNPNAPAKTKLARLEGRVLRDTDAKSLTVLRMAILKPLQIEEAFKGDAAAMGRAEAALAKALVAICDHFAEERAERLSSVDFAQQITG